MNQSVHSEVLKKIFIDLNLLFIYGIKVPPILPMIIQMLFLYQVVPNYLN